MVEPQQEESLVVVYYVYDVSLPRTWRNRKILRATFLVSVIRTGRLHFYFSVFLGSCLGWAFQLCDE